MTTIGIRRTIYDISDYCISPLTIQGCGKVYVDISLMARGSGSTLKVNNMIFDIQRIGDMVLKIQQQTNTIYMDERTMFSVEIIGAFARIRFKENGSWTTHIMSTNDWLQFAVAITRHQ